MAKQKSVSGIKVNNIPIQLDREKLKAEEVLRIAKEHDAMPGKPDSYELQGEKRLYKPDEWVDLNEDKSLKTVIRIVVNGLPIEVNEEKLKAEEVLRIAKEHDAMPGKPDSYELQGEKRLYKPDEWVDFSQDKEFITIPKGPTDVA